MFFMRTNFKHKEICSVIVIYRNKIKAFQKILKQHLQNFNQVIIVNNSPEISLDSFSSPQVTIINNQTNVGLASGLNLGILEAKKHGAKMVALFDQDTLLPDDFTKNMLQNINAYNSNKQTAIFAPNYFNHVTGRRNSIINFKLFRLIRSNPNKFKFFTHPQSVITSGSIIPINVLDKVGLMREELFIDFVDIEWCLRVRKQGYEIVAINKVMIDHHLGDYAVHFMGHHYPIHSPLRMYYYFRNAIYLYRLKEIDWNWRLVDGTRNLFRFLFYMLFVKNRTTYFKYIIKGYYHGLIKKNGQIGRIEG